MEKFIYRAFVLTLGVFFGWVSGVMNPPFWIAVGCIVFAIKLED